MTGKARHGFRLAAVVTPLPTALRALVPVRLAARVLALALLGAGAAGAAPGAEELADFDARIEYAYYAGETRSLAALTNEAEPFLAARLPWASYQAAHLEFRQARLARDQGDRPAAVAAGGGGAAPPAPPPRGPPGAPGARPG